MKVYYLKSMPQYSATKGPPRQLLRKDEPWVWPQACTEAVRALKARLTSPPVLAHLNISGPILFTCDASTTAMGAMLSYHLCQYNYSLQVASGRGFWLSSSLGLSPPQPHTQADCVGTLSRRRHPSEPLCLCRSSRRPPNKSLVFTNSVPTSRTAGLTRG